MLLDWCRKVRQKDQPGAYKRRIKLVDIEDYLPTLVCPSLDSARGNELYPTPGCRKVGSSHRETRRLQSSRMPRMMSATNRYLSTHNLATRIAMRIHLDTGPWIYIECAAPQATSSCRQAQAAFELKADICVSSFRPHRPPNPGEWIPSYRAC